MKKIAIANILKPVDDVRAFEKIAQSIAKTNKYEVNIIGNSGKKESGHPSIHFHPIPASSNSLISRFIAREKNLFKLLSLKPDILIITTHELLNVSLIVKMLIRCKVIYDVQENYKKNLEVISRRPMKKMLAAMVRFKERISRSFISQYWLAERCYQDELRFVRRRYLVLENTARKETVNRKKNPGFNLLFSGTISHYSGVLDAIKIYQELETQVQNTALVIVGQYHDHSLASELENLTARSKKITLKISKHPVPHDQILDEIFQADLGIISYQTNEAIKNKMPTKLYEYSRYRLPYLIQTGTTWEEKSRKLGGAIPVDFNSPDLPFIMDQIEKRDDLHLEKYPEDRTWEYSELEIISSLNSLSKD